MGLAFALSSQIALESFHFYSSFVCAYWLFTKLTPGNRRFLTVKQMVIVVVKQFVRLAPLYYIMLFAGWSSCSYLSTDPVWAYQKSLWYDCDSNWKERLLMISNLTIQQNLQTGCMYWSWAIQCDL